MKTNPVESLQELLAGALVGDLTLEEQATLETCLHDDPAALVAYQETQLMHDLLERTYRNAQPDPAFEQRMLSGVVSKIKKQQQHRETAWESVLVLWNGLREILQNRRIWQYGLPCGILIFLLSGIAFGPIPSGIKGAKSALRAPLGRQTEVPAVSLKLLAPSSMPQIIADYQARDMAKQAQNSPQVDSDNSVIVKSGEQEFRESVKAFPSSTPPPSPISAPQDAFVDQLRVGRAMPEQSGAVSSTPTDTRKLIRNAQLELEVPNYQTAIDQIASLTRSAGGYVDTSDSQRGGNGKLQGTLVVKMFPQNLDVFLLKLRSLGEVQNQTVRTEDVTKDYIDTRARLDNAQRMETQLQELLKHNDSKVSDLLQVERELARVRGEIEQMQGDLKLYDFQVEYATVTISLQEKDLGEAAAYLLKEQDEFSLFASDVETAFQQARQAAVDSKAQILSANLSHTSSGDVSATLLISVPAEQSEAFIKQIRQLGRVDNFTRQDQRVARDGGNANQPADNVHTKKDAVRVQLNIQADNQSQKHAALTIVTSVVDATFEKAKAAALASSDAEILSSSLDQVPNASSTAQVTVRVPGKSYLALLATFRALGRTSSFSLQRDDTTGPNQTGDDAPVTLLLTLTDDETPSQETDLAVRSDDVEANARRVKETAAADDVEVKASSFQRDADGAETARMTFRTPLLKYSNFLSRLEGLGHVETLTVHREDQINQSALDDAAPAEITFELHNQGAIVSDDQGLWPTIRRTFKEGIEALFASVQTIGVVLAFLIPWIILFSIFAWLGRRIYLFWQK